MFNIILRKGKDYGREYTEFRVHYGMLSGKSDETIGYSVYVPEATFERSHYDLYDKNWKHTCSTATRSSLAMDLMFNASDETLCFIKNPNSDNSQLLATAGDLSFEEVFEKINKQEEGYFKNAKGNRITFKELLEIIFNCSLSEPPSPPPPDNILAAILAIGILFVLICLAMLVPPVHEFLIEHYDTICYISGIVVRFALVPVGTLICYLIIRKYDSSKDTAGIRLAVILLSLFIFAVFGLSFGFISYEVLQWWDGIIIEGIAYKYITEDHIGFVLILLPWAAKLLYSIVIAILVKITRKKGSGRSATGLFAVNAFTTVVLVCLFYFTIWCAFLQVFGAWGVIGMLLLFGLLSLLALLLVNLPTRLVDK